MGINTCILLPVQARIEDVAQVMGILAGLKPEREELSCPDSWCVRVPGASIHASSSQFGCGDIILNGKMADGTWSHSCFVIAVSSSGQQAGYYTKAGLWISTAVSPFWEAIAEGLVRFFGGEYDRNDCDDVDCDFAWPQQPDITACDGEAWNEFQMRKMDVKPIRLGKRRSVPANASAGANSATPEAKA